MRASSSPIYSTHCRALQLTPYEVLSYLIAPSPTVMTTPYTPIPIDIKQWRKVDRDMVVEKFVVTAVWVPQQFEGTIDAQSRQLIHWRGGGVYRLANGSERSTSYDTRVWSDTGPEVEVQLISKDFGISTNAVDYWEAPLEKPYTTTDILNLIKDKQLHHFLYNGNGSGCLTWTRSPNCWVPAEPGAVFIERWSHLSPPRPVSPV
ncbi:hypothetical protein OH76DRAFT_1488588 [Lentinus brumalis]|uniref:DUF7770 domain-containing protein n=1 Tax=Lentinus brumalis TaxID=2498619 RepID=A0A371CQH6_9APHY|nr:hypothetical protein OH76DRAFT_1488588 [Polyporus brumalis]